MKDIKIDINELIKIASFDNYGAILYRLSARYFRYGYAHYFIGEFYNGISAGNLRIAFESFERLKIAPEEQNPSENATLYDSMRLILLFCVAYGAYPLAGRILKSLKADSFTDFFTTEELNTIRKHIK